MNTLLVILGILLFFFIVGLPFVLIYRWIKNSKKRKIASNLKKIDTDINLLDILITGLEKVQSENEKFSFMKDYQMWQNLSEEEKKERLMDIDIILKEGNEGIKKEMIKQGFPIGSKIIDINYFSGLSEHGTAIIGFIIQHETGGEIREVSINIDLAKMEFTTTRNSYKSSGKERYYYLKKRKGLIKV